MAEDNKVNKRKKIFKSAVIKPTDIGKEKELDKKKKPRRPKGLSEELNEELPGLLVRQDTTKLVPGFVVYVIEKIEHNRVIPYDTFKPSPRMLISVYNNGINNGTLCEAYSYKFVKNPDFEGYNKNSEKDGKKYMVVAEIEEFYSPLTKKQAEIMCKELNAESKRIYLMGLRKKMSKEKQ